MFYRFLNNKHVFTLDASSLSIESSKLIEIKSHFINTLGEFVGVASGTGSICSVADIKNIAESEKAGICILRTGSTINGVARLGSSSGIAKIIRLGFHDWIYESLLKNVNVLSNTTDSFTIINGFANDTVVSGISNGVFFRYGSKSPNWICVCKDNNTETEINSNVPVGINTWCKQRIEINKAGNETKFYINDLQIGVINTNIPKDVGKEVSVQLIISNIAGTIVARGLNVDYMELVGKY